MLCLSESDERASVRGVSAHSATRPATGDARPGDAMPSSAAAGAVSAMSMPATATASATARA